MQVIHLSIDTDFSELRLHTEPQILAIGDFDGVHSGHQEVIRRAVHRSEKLRVRSSVMTFHPHPREVLGLSQYGQVLTPLEDRLEQFAKLGVDNAYIVRFDHAFSALSSDSFVESILMALSVQTVVVGFDFTFGHKGAGTADTLCLQSKGRFAVEVVRPYHLEGEKVSSTRIRDCLLTGQPEIATLLLGRPYSIKGTVVTGEGRGRTIGVPTANIEVEHQYVIPARGVYAVRATVGEEILCGVMNIGVKPTFAENGLRPAMEAHLFDFNRSIYGELVKVEFIGFIRSERKFGSVDELIAQIREDMNRAKEMLG